MESYSKLSEQIETTVHPCCRCGSSAGPWDAIADKAYCPGCQEGMVLGDLSPLVEPTYRGLCAICTRTQVIAFDTVPLQSSEAIRLELCPQHLRSLLGRRLNREGYHALCRRLASDGLSSNEIFLLHTAFYDSTGKAMFPIDIVEID